MRRFLIVPAVVFAVAALAACGSSSGSKSGGSSGGSPYGGGSSSSGSSTSSASGGTGTPVALGAKDFSFSPTSLSIPAGGATIKITNTGSVEHNLTIEGTKVSKDAEAGGSATATVDLTAGTYSFHCKYHPTQMKGTITVG